MTALVSPTLAPGESNGHHGMPRGESPHPPRPDDTGRGASRKDDPRSVAKSVIGWVLLTFLTVSLVLIAVGPMLQQRTQRGLLGDYQVEIAQAAEQAAGLPGIEVPTVAPEVGSSVGVIEVGRLGLQQVVVEGADPGQTRMGPSHLPGSAAPGQPGNSVIVGRRMLFGGPFGSLDQLEVGDPILVTTTQGPSPYTVREVRTADLGDETQIAEVTGPSADDRLTLVTSSSAVPWNTDRAQVVVAEMDALPYQPTPQNGRSNHQLGSSGESGALPAVALALLVYVGAVIGSITALRNLSWRSAHLIATPVLVAATVMLAEQVSRLLPAWL